MYCPFCSYHDSKVIDSRLAQEGNLIRRRRECIECAKRFTTYERVEITIPLLIKKDGRREAFDGEKLMLGLRKACEKRPVSTAKLENIIQIVEKKLQNVSEKEIPTTLIGECVMEELRKLDEVAYVRFASVYRQFKHISEFMNELKEIENNRNL